MNVLFVCTGNTCRSAMAKAILSHLAEKSGREICADSCGVAAYPAPASQNAVLAVEELYGIDLKSHTAKMVDSSLVEKADVIFAMTPKHAQSLLSLFPECANKLLVASPQIADPYMQNLSVYKDCARQLYKQIQDRFIKES